MTRTSINKIVIAPNAFKHTLTAPEAAEAIAEGLKQGGLEAELVVHPVGDGGDGTGALLVSYLQGTSVIIPTENPFGRLVQAGIGLVDDGRTAIIEMASASGLALLKANELDPLTASSYGTGLLVREALDRGADEILLTLGGSATVDGGTGILRALGIRFLDANNQALNCIRDFERLQYIDASEVHPRIDSARLVLLCDVRNVICGPTGAATVFGPQKGADAVAVQQLDRSLMRLAACIHSSFGRPVLDLESGGAAGGTAAGLYGILGARLEPGIEAFLFRTGFEEVLRGASVVITGEGRVDSQTLSGKAPYGVAMAARKAGIPVMCIAGQVEVGAEPVLHKVFDQLISCESLPTATLSTIAARAKLRNAAAEAVPGLHNLLPHR